MKIRYIILSLLIIIVLIFISSISRNYKNKPQLTQINVGMGYVPNIQFAPFYVALEKDYFKQAGLEIKFNYGMETDVIQLLAKNNLQVGIASGDQVILAQNKGIKVLDFFNWYQKFPVTITSLASKNINNPEDLYGKTVGIPAVYGASYIGWKAFLSANNLDESKIKLEVIGYTQAASLTTGKVDAAVCYEMNEPVQLENQGYKVKNFNVYEDLNFVSNGLIANEAFLKQNPKLIGGFAKAFKKGLEDTINNPDAALEISKKYIPGITDLTIQKQILLSSINYWKAEKLGQNNQNQWVLSIEELRKLGLIDSNLNPADLYSNNYL